MQSQTDCKDGGFKGYNMSIKQVAIDPLLPKSIWWDISTQTPNKQEQEETTTFQVKTTQSQEVFKWTQSTSSAILQKIWPPAMSPFVYKLKYSAHKLVQDSQNISSYY